MTNRDDKLDEIARYIEGHADQTLGLYDLARRINLSTAYFQKVFTQRFGLSPKRFQDQCRRLRLKSTVRQGEGIIEAIFEAGFGSTSRVYEKASTMGMKLKAYEMGGAGEHIHYALRETALGWIIMGATSKGVCSVIIEDDTAKALGALRSEFPSAHLTQSLADQSLDGWMDMISLYVSHHGQRPILPLDLRGTLFQLKVWRLLTSLQEDEVISYSQLAERLGAPKAIRAAASACAANRVALLVPCHQVLRSDGSLGGYRWGLDRKKALLQMA
jgi:AraC family transcriptional regulator of adaptative response/methylated-DNA-[protein]-cysteine methyltransferase